MLPEQSKNIPIPESQNGEFSSKELNILRTLLKALPILMKEGANPSLDLERIADILNCPPDFAAVLVKRIPGFSITNEETFKVLNFAQIQEFLEKLLPQTEKKIEIAPEDLDNIKKFFDSHPHTKFLSTGIPFPSKINSKEAGKILEQLIKNGFINSEDSVIRGRNRTLYFKAAAKTPNDEEKTP
jgi:hypothetical protein